MSPKKLSDTDKREILDLYRQPEETTSTLALRYSVSSSTISRLLKSRLAEPEYEALIQQKRSARGTSNEPLAEDESQEGDRSRSQELEDIPEFEREEEALTSNSERRIRKRSRAATPDVETQAAAELPLANYQEADIYAPAQSINPEPLLDNYSPEASVLEEILGEDLTDLDDEDDDLEDTDEEDEDDWEDDLVSAEIQTAVKPFGSESRTNVQVLPLSEASLPKTCYLVVDRAAELIARPLREFGDLGAFSAEEVQQKTLPVFDNHRVARRYSNRTQRVIKIPDGRMLQKTCSYLKAKGITRLLIDGQVYSLL